MLDERREKVSEREEEKEREVDFRRHQKLLPVWSRSVTKAVVLLSLDVVHGVLTTRVPRPKKRRIR